MADGAQQAAGSPREVGRRHGWNSLQGYGNAAYARLRALEHEPFVAGGVSVVDTLVPCSGFLRLSGHVGCQSGLVLTFDKYLEIAPDDRVRVRLYSYNCHVQRSSDCVHYGNVLRYDNAHGRSFADDDLRDQLTTWHHRHEWDVPDADLTGGRRFWIGDADWTVKGRHEFPADDWPHLEEVVAELAQWHEVNARRLGLSTSAADLKRCPRPPLTLPRLA